jgi:hypothetical protein
LHNTMALLSSQAALQSFQSFQSDPIANANFVFLKSTCCKSASNSPSEILHSPLVYCQNYTESGIIWGPNQSQVPVRQVTGIFWLEEAPVVSTFNSCKQAAWSSKYPVRFGKALIGLFVCH